MLRKYCFEQSIFSLAWISIVFSQLLSNMEIIQVPGGLEVVIIPHNACVKIEVKPQKRQARPKDGRFLTM